MCWPLAVIGQTSSAQEQALAFVHALASAPNTNLDNSLNQVYNQRLAKATQNRITSQQFKNEWVPELTKWQGKLLALEGDVSNRMSSWQGQNGVFSATRIDVQLKTQAASVFIVAERINADWKIVHWEIS